ncbi:UDP-N-acetylmuramate dehydrogenase [Marinobacterium marinum]|uniref:UDP-N-acetylenolpyruvoylglucosamine reductase n=1 Tax=Marinobacterium marinum TaxID=2756129 RepID=A0A7W1WX94_9GAMM|nr:UDP-N-acetylmuramate dehydrogenase [Marinobacterium marinum]MBA4501871.1 UDP-N-acetylmuramate dehydrogenase [Marinobacterium marinum]
MSDLSIEYQASLRHLNTFGFEVTADQLVMIRDTEQLAQLMGRLSQDPQPLLVLGGGSNLVLAEHVPGVVACMAIRRWEPTIEADRVRLWVGAGESWHETVEHTLRQGWYGLENLALIPGTVGAAPVQNIGAYGVELKDRLSRVEVFDCMESRLKILEREACGFAYRDSLFKSGEPGRYIITAVELNLSLIPDVQVGYAALRTALGDVREPDPQQVFDAVCVVRRSKLPSPDRVGNAGSFFKNPVISDKECRRLCTQEPDLVFYPDSSGGCKLAAGWLIDRCGLKGYRQNSVGVYPDQALVLVNWGGGDREAIERLAEYIQLKVRERFGVELEPEPRFYP